MALSLRWILKDFNYMKAFIYDTSVYPLTFDSCNFFAIAQSILKVTKQSGADMVIKAYSFRENMIHEEDYTDAVRTKKLNDCLVDLAEMSSWVNSVSIIRRREGLENFKSFDWMFENTSLESKLPRLYDFKSILSIDKSSMEYLNELFIPKVADKKKYDKIFSETKKSILFFQRKSVQKPIRNTPENLFEECCKLLRSSGVSAFIVPDAELICSPLYYNNEIYFPEIGRTIFDRIAAANSADLVVTWGGGISAPLWFSPCNLLVMGLNNKFCPKDLEEAKIKGPFPFEQPPWFGSNKQFIWKEQQELTPESVSQIILDKLK